MPPVWKVRIVSWVPGSPIDWAAMTPTASPISMGDAGGQRTAVALGADAEVGLAGEGRTHPDPVGRLVVADVDHGLFVDHEPGLVDRAVGERDVLEQDPAEEPGLDVAPLAGGVGDKGGSALVDHESITTTNGQPCRSRHGSRSPSIPHRDRRHLPGSIGEPGWRNGPAPAARRLRRRRSPRRRRAVRTRTSSSSSRGREGPRGVRRGDEEGYAVPLAASNHRRWR